MQSPKFKFLREDLDVVFTVKQLKDEWKRLKGHLRKQLIFDAIEYRDLSDKIDPNLYRLRRDIIHGDYAVKQPKRYLVEKSLGLCRQMTLVHPRDLLVLERLSRSIYLELKSKAPSTSAYFEPDDGNFKGRLSPAEFQYGSFASWKRFQKAVFGFAEENTFVIVTDVANFYDFINFQHLRNIVSSLADIREPVLDLLIYVLNRLTWTPDFMPLTQVGMPQIETTATRVLANAMLYEVDKICETSAAANYARFMDDMDIGVDSIPVAKCLIRDIDLTLQSRQLRLNSSKTRILSQQEAFSHFCIAENLRLTRLDHILDSGKHFKLALKILKASYEKWLDRTPTFGPGTKSHFVKGNGQKIHKYVLSLIYKAGGKVPSEDLIWLVRNSPGMRSTALRHLGFAPEETAHVFQLVKMLSGGVFVDDASIVYAAGYLLHGRLPDTSFTRTLVGEFCSLAAAKGDIGLHSAIFVAARVLSEDELLDLLKNHSPRISDDFWLARAAAGVAPRFFGSAKNWSEYHEFILNLDSENAFDVLNYMISVAQDSSYSPSLKAYLAAPNESFPLKLYFPKVLILLAASKNPSIGSLFPSLHSTHPELLGDTYYHSMGFV